MHRSFLLFLLSLVSVTFLWLQISVFSKIEHSRKDILGLVPSFIFKGWSDKKQVVKTDFLELIQDFHEACVKNRVTVFVIDPSILQNILKEQIRIEKNSFDPAKCIHFCHKSSITFGLLATYWNIHILNDLKDRDISFVSATGQDPRLISLDGITPSTIPLHFFFTRHEFVIHVVLLYERGDLGLWHGSLFQGDLSLQLDTVNRNKVGKAQASYERFQNESVLNRFSLKIATVDGLLIRLPSDVDLFLRDLESSRFLPCNFKRAQKFYSKYGDDRSDAANAFRKRGKDVLQIAKIILDNLGVRFWLSSGTCLGWFRQCNVISHGKDMDIGIWIKDYNEKLIQEFQNDGLYLEHVFGKVQDSYQMSFRTVDDVKLDIFFFYEEKTYMWNGGTQAKSGKKFKYIFPKFSMCWTEFLGMKVRVPCDTQTYIEANYGTSWAIPIKQWDWKRSPSNVIENGKWDEKDLPEVIQFFELQ